jgi:hypothetical protein
MNCPRCGSNNYDHIDGHYTWSMSCNDCGFFWVERQVYNITVEDRLKLISEYRKKGAKQLRELKKSLKQLNFADEPATLELAVKNSDKIFSELHRSFRVIRGCQELIDKSKGTTVNRS